MHTPAFDRFHDISANDTLSSPYHTLGPGGHTRMLNCVVEGRCIVLLFKFLGVNDEKVTKVVVVFTAGFGGDVPTGRLATFHVLAPSQPFHIFALLLVVLCQNAAFEMGRSRCRILMIIGNFHHS